MEYKQITEQLDIYTGQILEALEIVRDFIIEKKLILTGGQAIDSALRLRGSSIYSAEDIPDYDVFSTNHAADAYELSVRLFNHFGSEVKPQAIRALHPTTMRVRIHFTAVADITYAPKSVFDSIPTLNYNNMKIRSPLHQRMDMHRALSFPFDDPPLETIFNRFKKDITRFELIDSVYPISFDLEILKILTITKHSIKLPKVTENATYAIGGIIGYSQIWNVFAGAIKTADEVIIPMKSKILSNNVIKFDWLGQLEKLPVITLYTQKPEELIRLITKGDKPLKIEQFNPYMDFHPRCYKLYYKAHIIEIYDTDDRLLSCVKVGNNFIVCNQYTLSYYLYKYFLEKNEYYLALYNSLLNILKNTSEVEDNPLLGLSTTTIGETNYSPSYINLINMAKEKIGEESQFEQYVLPENYYITSENKNKLPEFNYVGNVLFELNGEIKNKINIWNK
jgi:hypothetical protein